MSIPLHRSTILSLAVPRQRICGAPGELKKLLLSLSVSSTNGNGAETQREYWMREFDDIQHDGCIGFDEFQLHLARSALGFNAFWLFK